MGSNTGTQKAQLDTQNQLAAQQLARQNSSLDTLKSSFSPYLTGNQGFTPEQMAALRSQALDQNASRYGQATKQTNAMLAGRGENGMTPGGGMQAAAYGSLNASKAGDLADALRTVTLNDAQQGLANKFNAGAVISGNAQTLAGNVGTFNSGAASALGNYTQAQNNGMLGKFTTALGSGLGSGLGAGITGGVGSALSKAGSGNWGW